MENKILLSKVKEDMRELENEQYSRDKFYRLFNFIVGFLVSIGFATKKGIFIEFYFWYQAKYNFKYSLSLDYIVLKIHCEENSESAFITLYNNFIEYLETTSFFQSDVKGTLKDEIVENIKIQFTIHLERSLQCPGCFVDLKQDTLYVYDVFRGYTLGISGILDIDLRAKIAGYLTAQQNKLPNNIYTDNWFYLLANIEDFDELKHDPKRVYLEICNRLLIFLSDDAALTS